MTKPKDTLETTSDRYIAAFEIAEWLESIKDEYPELSYHANGIRELAHTLLVEHPGEETVL